MPQPPKKSTSDFNKNADNFVRDPADVLRAINAVKARTGDKQQQARDTAHRLEQEKFKSYYRILDPVFQALESLPAQNGLEFFIRRDLIERPATATTAPERDINIWLFYTRATGTPMMESVPSTHSVTVLAKNTFPHSKNPRIGLALSTKPLLHIAAQPLNGTEQITSRIQTERYVRESATPKPPGTYRGEFREVNDVQHTAAHRTFKEIVGIIDKWVSIAAPERLQEVRDALGKIDTGGLQDDLTVHRPLKLKSTPPGQK